MIKVSDSQRPRRQAAVTVGDGGDAHAHQGARISRELFSWRPPLRSPDAAILPDWGALTARGEDLVRNHGMLSGGAQIHVDSIVGAGLRLSAKPAFKELGLSAEWAAEWSKNTERAYNLWAYDIDHHCDATRRISVPAMLGQACRTGLMTGDILATAEWIEDESYPYSTAIQMIDPARLSNPGEAPDTALLRGGIEYNRQGVPVAGHIRNALRSDILFDVRGVYEWRRVPFRTSWGRRQLLHQYDEQRPGQSRGKTGFSAIVKRSKMLDRFQDSTLEAALSHAMYAAVLESSFNSEAVAQAMGGDESIQNYLEGVTKFYGDAPVKMDGVRIPHLYPGEELKFTTPGQPGPQFADFEQSVLRHLASGLNISYEELARDYSKTNYSGARAAAEQSWRFFTGRRELVMAPFATQIYALWLEEAMDKEIVETPPGVADFWSAKTAWTRCRWIGPKKGSIDQLKESKADVLEMHEDLLTLEDACAARGTDWEEVLEQIAREKKRKRELETQYGISFDENDIAGIVGGPQEPTDAAI